MHVAEVPGGEHVLPLVPPLAMHKHGRQERGLRKAAGIMRLELVNACAFCCMHNLLATISTKHDRSCRVEDHATTAAKGGCLSFIHDGR